MNPQQEKQLDERLRAAFEPDPHTINRIVASALHAGAIRRPGLRLAAAGAAVIVLIASALFVARQPASPQPESVRLEYVGDVNVLEFPDGTSWVVTPDAGRGPRTHVNLILVGGDKP